MENPTHKDQATDGSLQEWIERAKRTHELVDAVDLKKIADHDPSEREKLREVSGALTEISNGNDIDHVEGVDEVSSGLDPRAERRAQLVKLITAAGWADRIGRILSREDGSDALSPLELIPHQAGLPDFDLCLAPESANTDGCFGIFITEHGVVAAGIGHPVSKHHWRIAHSQPHGGIEQVCSVINSYAQNVFD